MDLLPGVRVGAFEILGPLGSGGMGEVHRARDTRLGREVALKVLPRSLSQDAERLARFDREARLLAALNYPGIGAIYGIEESAAGPLLVLELVPGETLAGRISRGPLPLKEAVAICRQIADAVAFAHAQGIVHRDLKPANVKCTPDGRVKVLDFGLAKAVAAEPTRSEPDDATITRGDTREGAVLGTPAYMSPEQMRATEVDRRTDIWSFGCVLYEALTGRRPFHRATRTDTLVAVLEQEPDWSALPASTPSAIRELLQRCLQRDRDRRMHDMADVRIELEEAFASAIEVSVDAGSARPDPGRAGTLDLVAVGVLALSIAGNLVLRDRLVSPLATLHEELSLELPLPLRAYLISTKWGVLVLAAFALLWGAFAVIGRPFLAQARRPLLLATATVAAVATLAGLWLVAEGGVFYAMRLSLGWKATVVERDLSTLHLAAGEPGLAIALIDPQRSGDYPASKLAWWGAPGTVFQLAEAYRAAGDLDAARRLYRRAQEAATAFDELLSQEVLSQQERWQAQSGFDLAPWTPSIGHLRKLPDLVRAVANQRLQQLTSGDASARRAPTSAPR